MAVKRRQIQTIPGMNDVQLLAHLLSMSGLDATSARALSRSLLEAFQSLERVLTAPPDTLLRHPELGENAAVFLLLLAAMMKRYGGAPAPWPVYPGDEKAVAKLLRPHFYAQRAERVYALCLDEEFNLISGALCAQGDASAVSCSVNRVLEMALSHRSAGVILAHNHPDGTTEFSKSDLAATGALHMALSTVDISLVDHYLWTDGELVSLRVQAAQHPELFAAFPLPHGWFPLDRHDKSPAL